MDVGELCKRLKREDLTLEDFPRHDERECTELLEALGYQDVLERARVRKAVLAHFSQVSVGADVQQKARASDGAAPRSSRYDRPRRGAGEAAGAGEIAVATPRKSRYEASLLRETRGREWELRRLVQGVHSEPGPASVLTDGALEGVPALLDPPRAHSPCRRPFPPKEGREWSLRRAYPGEVGEEVCPAALKRLADGRQFGAAIYPPVPQSPLRTPRAPEEGRDRAQRRAAALATLGACTEPLSLVALGADSGGPKAQRPGRSIRYLAPRRQAVGRQAALRRLAASPPRSGGESPSDGSDEEPEEPRGGEP